MKALCLLTLLFGQAALAATPWNRTCVNPNLSIEAKSIGDFAKLLRIQKMSNGPTHTSSGGFKDPSWHGMTLVFNAKACQESSTFCHATAKDFTMTVWDKQGQVVQLPPMDSIQFALTYRAHGSALAPLGTASSQFVFGEFPATGDCELK